MNAHELAVAMLAKFGVVKQTYIVAEELNELQKELFKTNRGVKDNLHLAEEIADVEICLEQLKVAYPEAAKLVPRYVQAKIDRTVARYLAPKGVPTNDGRVQESESDL